MPRTHLTLVLLACATACTPRYLAPPRAPARVLRVEVDEVEAPRDGEGQVTLDVVGGPARAERITSRLHTSGAAATTAVRGRWQVGPMPGLPQITTTPLCMTPCRVNLPLGTHELLFSELLPGGPRSSTAFVRVGERPSVVRHALGAQEAYPGRLVSGLLLLGFGFAGVLTGGMLAAFNETETVSGERIDLAPAGYVSLGIGAALITGGALLLGYGRPTIRPGATTQWTP